MFSGAKQTVLDTIQATKAEITHAQEVADTIAEGLAALRDAPGSHFKFNMAAQNNGSHEIKVTTNVPGPGGEGSLIQLYIGSSGIVTSQSNYPYYSDYKKNNAQGNREVLDDITKKAKLYRLVP